MFDNQAACEHLLRMRSSIGDSSSKQGPTVMSMLLVLANAIIVIGSLAAAAYFLLRMYGQILIRLDAIERELLFARRSPPPPAEQLVGVPLPANEDPLIASRLNRQGLSPGEVAPEFSISRVDGGGELSPATYRGRSTVVLFVSADCIPCQVVLHRLAQLDKTKLSQHLAIVARGPLETIRKKLAAHHLAVPTGIQDGWQISRLFGTFKMPSAVVIDGAGLIRIGQVLGPDAIVSCICDVVAQDDEAITSTTQAFSSDTLFAKID